VKFIPCFLFLPFVLLSCHPGHPTESTTSAGNIKKDSIIYPFTPRYSINWQPGDEKNALMVLNCLKNYVAGDLRATLKDFSDTTEFVADNFHFRGPKDSLAILLGQTRSEMVRLSKDFDSWMTTYYPDKNDTWVTLWYKETWTDKKGKTDSLFYTDDVLIKNGKIVLYDEKQRRPPLAESKN
jgi:hypothetical protein